MPVCFQLTRIGEIEPAYLTDVDAELCQQFEIPFSEHTYAYGWYDDIGFKLALGKSWDELADQYQKYSYTTSQYQEHELMMLRMVHYLRQHYVVDAWREHK